GSFGRGEATRRGAAQRLKPEGSTVLFRGERTGFCGGLRDLSAFRGRNRFVCRNRRCAGRISGLRSAVQKRMRRFRLTSLVAGAVLAGVISSPASAQEQRSEEHTSELQSR